MKRGIKVETLCMLARVALRSGELAVVASRAAQAGDVARSTGQDRLERMPLHMQAVAARMRRDYRR